VKYADPRPLLPFRVHFDDLALQPFDVTACTAEEARDVAEAAFPNCKISKTKIVRERI